MGIPFTTGLTVAVLKILAASIYAVGLFFLATHLLHIPSFNEAQNLRGLAKKVTTGSDFFSVMIDHIAAFLKRFIRIGAFKRKRLVSQFEQLGIQETPEEYYSKIAAKTLLFTVCVLVGFLIHPVVGVFLLLFDVLFFLLQYNEIDKIIQKKKEDIESELPKFVSVIEQTFKNDRDVIKMLSTYVENGDSPLVSELRKTLADMKTGDFETALDRLAARVDSVFLAETVRGLKSALHGDNTVEYFITLNAKIWDHEKAIIQKKALKTPSKVKILTKVLLCCMFLIYIVVFATVIYEGLHDIFTML